MKKEEVGRERKRELDVVDGWGWNRAYGFNDPPVLVDSLDPIIRRVELSSSLFLCYLPSSRGREERTLFLARHSLLRLFFLALPTSSCFVLIFLSLASRMLLTSLVFRLAAVAIYTRSLTN